MLSAAGTNDSMFFAALEVPVSISGEQAQVRTDQAPVAGKAQNTAVIMSAERQIGAPGEGRMHHLGMMCEKNGKTRIFAVSEYLLQFPNGHSMIVKSGVIMRRHVKAADPDRYALQRNAAVCILQELTAGMVERSAVFLIHCAVCLGIQTRAVFVIAGSNLQRIL